MSKEKGRRALLQEMYNPNRREYPVVQDAEEIFDLCMDVFDPTIDGNFFCGRLEKDDREQRMCYC